jgi:arsenite methyltransferase
VSRRVLSRPPYDRYREPERSGERRVNAGELGALLAEAGFAVRSIEVVQHAIHVASATDAVEFSRASSFGNFLGHLPEAVRAQARNDITEELEKLRTPEGIPHNGARIFAIATGDPTE